MDDLENRLRNWGRAVRDPRSRDARAWSLEGNYRRSSTEEAEDEAPRRRLPSPDVDDAWDIEIAARLLPIAHHVLLWLRYVKRWDDDDVIRHWRTLMSEPMSKRTLQEMDASSRINLATALELPQVVRKERAIRVVRGILRHALDLPEISMA